ncbi:MAG TPA: ferritin-like domain-containing protein [Methylococcus sp.]|nr:ferritin-like domain-containing protein [Methylococcus sp.]
MTASTNAFVLAERCLCATDPESKLAWTHEAAERARSGQLDFTPRDVSLPIQAVRFPERPLWVAPRELLRRAIYTPQGRVALLHAVAHIEFTAIQLARDHLYRFRGLPEEYYRDWLTVAAEEAEHFALVRDRLRELGVDYGELPVHGGLWGIARETAYDVAARMALVPRCLESPGIGRDAGNDRKAPPSR